MSLPENVLGNITEITIRRNVSYFSDEYGMISTFVVVIAKKGADFATLVDAMFSHFNMNMAILSVEGEVITIYIHIRWGTELNDYEDVAKYIIQGIDAKSTGTYIGQPNSWIPLRTDMWYHTTSAFALPEGEKRARIVTLNHSVRFPGEYTVVFGEIPEGFEKRFQKPPRCDAVAL